MKPLKPSGISNAVTWKSDHQRSRVITPIQALLRHQKYVFGGKKPRTSTHGFSLSPVFRSMNAIDLMMIVIQV